MTDAVLETDLPEDVVRLIDRTLYEEDGQFPVERGYIWTACASVENGNPLYWDEGVAGTVTSLAAMAQSLNMPIDIIPCPTLRDPDRRTDPRQAR